MQNEITLRPYYPNPFKPAGIEFELPEQAEITLEVFDKNGKPYKTIYDKETMINGIHKLDLNSFHLDEGEYTLRLSGNILGKEFRTTKSIVIGK